MNRASKKSRMRRTITIGSAFAGVLLLLAIVAFFNASSVVDARKQGLLQQKVHQFVSRWVGELKKGAFPSSDYTLESVEIRAAMAGVNIIRRAKTDDLSTALPRPAGAGLGWSFSFGDQTSSKYSAQDEINKENVGFLQPAWVYETPESPRNIQATPIYTGKFLVLRDSRGQVVALDPVSGEERWQFAPVESGSISRGLNYVHSGSPGAGQILFSSGGRLYSLDAFTGLLNETFGSDGSVVIGYESRTAPLVDNGTVIVASYRPGLHAYSLEDGEHIWSLDINTGRTYDRRRALLVSLPHYPSSARPWGGMALDSQRNLVFVSTSDPGPVGIGIDRSGNNAPANSVVAVDTKSGNIRWVFQDVAHDLWDLDIAAPPILGSIEREGQLVDVVFVSTKSGNLFIVDRETGAPVFDLHQRRAPISRIPGERTAPYQHDPVLPQPFGSATFDLNRITNIGLRNSAFVSAQIESATYGFFPAHRPNRPTVFFGLHGGASQLGAAFNPITREIFVSSSHVPAMITLVESNLEMAETLGDSRGAALWKDHCASCHGSFFQGTEIAPTLRGEVFSYSLEGFANMLDTGIREMPAVDGLSSSDIAILHGFLSSSLHEEVSEAGSGMSEIDPTLLVRQPYKFLRDHEGYPGSRPPWGTLTAYNADTGTIRWQVPLGRYDELLDRGIPQTGTQNVGGPIVTAGGLVFVSGTLDNLIRAFDAETGAELWEYRLPFVGSASPMTFDHEGVQYLVIPATGGGVLSQYNSDVETGSSFVTFRLDSDA